jgi:catechol 2,3-dioxygenase-like lactoylglutathione lyase family enzyme
MAGDARLGTVVVFVQDLDRSVSFYLDLLEFEVADRSPTAALLVSVGGTQLILRAMGQDAAHALGSIGYQYAVWTAAGKDDLDRAEQVLKKRSAHRETRGYGPVTVVEGRDPDDIPVLICYPGPEQDAEHKLAPRIYGW